MATDTRVWADEAIAPGRTLAETLEALGMSQTELARRANRPPQVISEIIQGKKEITPETAIEFERVLGVPAHLWIGLESTFRMTNARLAEVARLPSEVPAASAYPYNEMAKLGWVPKTRDKAERAEALLRFFGVATLGRVEFAATWRRAPLKAVSKHALAAWLRKGEIGAKEIQCGPFDEGAVRAVVARIPAITRLQPPEFQTQLVDGLAAAGVALVFVKHLPHTGAQGATRWRGARAIVQLSVRYGWADIFWFTLLHELAHVLKHGRREMFVDFTGGSDDPREAEADRFAAAHLLPEDAYRRFVESGGVGQAQRVRAFADAVGVHPGIVVGRLQHERKLGHALLNNLRVKYVLREDDGQD